MRRINKQFRALLIVISISIMIYLLLASFTCKKLNCLFLKDGDRYRVKETYEDNKYTYRALYEKDKVLLRVEIRNNYSVQESAQYIESQIVRTKGIFEEAAAPYPGELSDIISCGKEFQPIYSRKKQNGIEISYFSGFINERLVFGSCANEQSAYKDTLAMFYCANQKKFYQLEVITPNNREAVTDDQNQEILDSIACRE